MLKIDILLELLKYNFEIAQHGQSVSRKDAETQRFIIQ